MRSLFQQIGLTRAVLRSLTVKRRHVGLSDPEKAIITVACQQFIEAEILADNPPHSVQLSD